jgi:glycosyltransferase involved in cell wall biosynthesis
MNDSALLEEPSTSSPASVRPAARVCAAIGVVVSRFPRIDETYILREINELERQGQPVVLIPLLRESSRVIHEEAKPWLRRALYTPLLSAEILRSNVALFLRGPLRYLRLLFELIAGTIVRPRTFIRTLALFPKAVHLARELPKRGVEHIHSHFATHATTTAYVISRLSSITFSFTVHGPDVFVHRLLLPQKLARAKFVRTVSTFNKAFLDGLYPTLTKNKIEVIHMGLNPAVYERAEAEAKPGTRTRLLSVAALLPNKGFPYLIDAVARLIADGVDIDCTIVGHGPLREATEEWIRDRGLAERVHLLGAVPQHEVAKLMGNADIFVLSSIIALDGQMDGIPMSLVEAMAAGCPVIASALSGIPELVEHGVSGLLVDATHPERVAAAIRRLAHDPALRERMGKAGRARVRNQFDVAITASSFIELVERHEPVRAAAAQQVSALNWDKLSICAVGVRRTVERSDGLVADVTVTDGIAKREVIAKLRRQQEDESAPAAARHEYATLRDLRRVMTATSVDATANVVFTVPRALLLDETHAAIVTERAAGQTLESLIRQNLHRGTSRLITPMRRAGIWLRLMQEQTRSDDDGRHLLTARVVLALRDLELAAAAERAIRRDFATIADRIRALEAYAATQPLPVVGHHGEFTAANLFVSARRVEVINLGYYREGLPLGDVASFLLHLETTFPGRGARLAESRDAFLAGFTDTSIDARTLALFRLLAALQMLARNAEGFEPAGSARRALLGAILEPAE